MHTNYRKLITCGTCKLSMQPTECTYYMPNKAKTPEVDIVKRDQKQKQSNESELQSDLRSQTKTTNTKY